MLNEIWHLHESPERLHLKLTKKTNKQTKNNPKQTPKNKTYQSGKHFKFYTCLYFSFLSPHSA